MGNKCCATCQYGSYDETQVYTCTNEESEYFTDFVETDHSCIDYIPKEAD